MLPTKKKILTPKAASQWVKNQQKKRKKIVFTNGCFDLLHSGHIQYLEQAKSMGNYLLVALNGDLSVQKLKGKGRPIVTLKDRLKVIAGLECVDCVTWFHTETPANIIKNLSPNILVKGGDWKIENIVGADHVMSKGGKVYSLSFVNGKSTTSLIKKAKQK
ncbi:MAG: D-glycero-beta-D-manno-heptose 1-phosphate adenylyltransferase [Oligoflexia bacterium]|nr:D-glycero-beta-D-manno-heptose 1-phosphate adenylyltransferase [Oligoflexia bacterium]